MSTDSTFRMTIAEVFTIPGLGTVAAGQIEMGTINVYDEIWIHGSGDAVKTGVASIQSGANRVKTARAGDLVGIVLRGVGEDRVQAGNVLSAQR